MRKELNQSKVFMKALQKKQSRNTIEVKEKCLKRTVKIEGDSRRRVKVSKLCVLIKSKQIINFKEW